MSRLHLKYGLVAEQDRLSSSADAMAVTEPSTGSKSRTKGNLYVVVSSSVKGGRARDATRLIADSIRRDYYYDESAGIPICLQKAFRSAERRLRNSREGHGVPAGSLGIALAVIRGSELYVATTGPAEAYLVRAARLLMPEHEPGPGLPTGDDLRVDVWRGEFAVGDSLLLVSRDLTEVVGTEELKNSIVTLHPQSAVEHLHHLFVAAGGEGSDAVLAIEATDAPPTRAGNRLVAVDEPSGPGMGEPAYAGGIASAVGSRAVGARDAVGSAIGGMTERIGDLIPGRQRQYRRITPQVSRREAQRRAAIAFLGFLAVILVLGVLIWVFPRDTEDPIERIGAGEAAFSAALSRTDQVLEGDLISDDPERALQLLREAWREAGRAGETGVPASQVEPLRERIAGGLERLYGTNRMSATLVHRLTGGETAHDARDLVLGPDGAAYVVDEAARTVVRVDPATGAAATVVQAGDGGGEGIGTPTMLSVGGPDLLIVDNRGNLWRWRPSDAQGSGTLGQITVSGDTAWGDDIVAIGTFLLPRQEEDGLYNLYVVDPSSDQILRYQPTADGSAFSAPTDYLATATDQVDRWRDMLIDGDVYTLLPDGVVRHESGRVQSFELQVPPDDADLRPGRDFRLMASTPARRQGPLYIWDAQHARLLVFDKSTGEYEAQWLVAGTPQLSDLRGMVVLTPPAAPTASPGASPAPGASPGAAGAPTLLWLTSDALYRSPLVAVSDAPAASPSPEPSVVAPPASPEPSAEPTRRPRRTPRPTGGGGGGGGG